MKRISQRSYESLCEGLMNQLDDDDFMASLQEFVDAVAFQGFDPVITLNQLKNKETSIDTLNSEMCQLLVHYHSRGTKILANTCNMTEGRIIIKELITKYNIKKKLSRSRSKEVITLGRISATFPRESCMMLHKFKITKIFKIRCVEGFGEFPFACMTMAFMSIFYCEDDIKVYDVIKGCLYYYLNESDIINTKSKNADWIALNKDDKGVRVIIFAEKAWLSDQFSKNDRIAITTKLQILQEEPYAALKKAGERFIHQTGLSNDFIKSKFPI